MPPFINDLADAIVECEQPVAIHLRCRNIRRHVDAARFHDHGIDQLIDELHVHCSREGGAELVRKGSMRRALNRVTLANAMVMVASNAKIK
jgi:hypothetical protein